MSDDNEIKVIVVECANRRYYQLRWHDPMSGRVKSQSSKVEITGRKREERLAREAAGALEAALREGRHKAPAKITWEEFRQRSLISPVCKGKISGFGWRSYILALTELADYLEKVK